MSTNLNTNNSSQTLFRFAAMRNPELSDPKNLDRRFIFRDKALAAASIFDSNLQAEKTLQAICRKINQSGSGVTLTIFKESDFKDIDSGKVYELAVWVARNKSTATKNEFDQEIEAYKTSNPSLDHLPNRSLIWDNLVYQVTTQKDFYAKELIMQYLHLLHILEVYDGSEESFEDMKKAKVVLPKELFKVSPTEPNGASTSSATQKVVFDNKAMKFTEATIMLKENEDLTNSLLKLEKAYKKSYDETYKTAYTQYEKEVKPLIQSARKDSAETDRKRSILENRINYLTQLSVANPEKFYENSELDMELHRIKDEIMQITTPDVEIPEFDFEFETPEIDAAQLGRTLKSQDQTTLNRLFGTSTITDALAEITSFEELNQHITQNNQLLQQTVLDNTVLNQQVSAIIGGVVIPVNNNTTNNQVVSFFARTWAPLYMGSASITIMTDINQPKQVISGNYQLKDANQQLLISSSSTNTYAAPNLSSLFSGLESISYSILNKYEVFHLEGEVTLDDGFVYIMQATLNVTANNTYKFEGPGTLTRKDRGTSGTENPQNPTDPENPQTPNQPVNTEAFIPSGFGMKNIGVADYLKVEQSTYCYVEGDVAHIENIMAREYKERSTRRLKRSESQTTKSTESEKEKLTDTTSTERHEMQSEISKILQESRDFAAQTGFQASWGPEKARFIANANASYATHNSKEESNRQAVTEAKDITARALDRIVTKVKDERIDKILEEYEENNKHGFDNTKGSNHVVGVYRWVDKVVKNQIYNYGKRMMFEFMIPEPAKLHTLGLKMIDESEKLVKPVDPRESSTYKMENFMSLDGLSGETILKFWSSKYNVEIEKKLDDIIFVGKASSGTAEESLGSEYDEAIAGSFEIQIPENYVATASRSTANTGGEGVLGGVKLKIGGKDVNVSGYETSLDGNFYPTVPVSFSFIGSHAVDVNASVKCKLTQEAKNAWLQSTFNKIIEAYEVELEKYNQALAEAKALGVQIKGSNPGFYRKIENTILRRNCISYMINQDPTAALTFGKNKYYNTNGATESFTNTEIKLDSGLDQYTAFVKFMEQAFEWDIMSYYFYPYYWGNREKWENMYQFDDNDPTFRAFMQSGMARVIVTVRPGFEEAVRHFLATGQIWNGGEVPVIDDPLFLSIVDEMRSAVGKKQGEPWREKIPTSLTILQADSIGLKVEKALPCNCEPGVKFDDQLGEMCVSNFELNNNQIGQSSDKWMEISFNDLDTNYSRISQMDTDNFFPREYKCLNNTITIDRDASWSPDDSVVKIHQVLADEISSIEGVEAHTLGNDGITFKINVSKISTFTFKKPGKSESFDLLKFSVDLNNSTLKIMSPEYGSYGDVRILDKDKQVIPQAEYLDKVPLSKFLV